MKLLSSVSAFVAMLSASMVIVSNNNQADAAILNLPRPNQWRTRWPALPTEMRHQYFVKSIKDLEVAGDLNIGPFVKEDKQ
jgi:hypothetical protein